MTSSIIERLDTALVEDSADGLFRCDRAIFSDGGFFEVEMKHLFEGNWVYLAHESQIPNKNDYFTTWMGRQPIFIARNKDNERWFLMTASLTPFASDARLTTSASGRSPHLSSLTPMTAASATPAHCEIRSSICNDETHSPPVLITSLIRSVMWT